MPNYATTSDLTARFPDEDAVARLTNQDYQDGDSIDTSVLTTFLDQAEGLINSYIGMRYLVPVATTDDSVAALMKRITLDVAQYNLASTSEILTDAKQVLYDAVIEWLEKISEGKVILPGGDPIASTTSRPSRVNSSFGTREFTREKQSGL